MAALRLPALAADIAAGGTAATVGHAGRSARAKRANAAAQEECRLSRDALKPRLSIQVLLLRLRNHPEGSAGAAVAIIIDVVVFVDRVCRGCARLLRRLLGPAAFFLVRLLLLVRRRRRRLLLASRRRRRLLIASRRRLGRRHRRRRLRLLQQRAPALTSSLSKSLHLLELAPQRIGASRRRRLGSGCLVVISGVLQRPLEQTCRRRHNGALRCTVLAAREPRLECVPHSATRRVALLQLDGISHAQQQHCRRACEAAAAQLPIIETRRKCSP